MSQLSLSQVLDQEHERVTAKDAEACGADHHGSTEPDELCMRVKGHELTGALAREAHAALVQGVASRYWLTWANVTTTGRATSELTKSDGS